MVLDPSRNRILGETLTLTTHDKLSRALFHASYTFQKKLSHTADSQDQRHRMTPASRPALPAYLSDEPDYVVPMLVADVPEAAELYRSTMEETWRAIGELRSRGVSDEFAAYLLPNAVAIRFTESGDLLNLHHKFAMRLCYNAQEEIWRASLDEALQIREVNPRIGPWLLPPCTLRHLAQVRPVCPGGRALLRRGRLEAAGRGVRPGAVRAATNQRRRGRADPAYGRGLAGDVGARGVLVLDPQRRAEDALPPRDHDRRDAVAHHVDGRARHVHQLVDREDHRDARLARQAEGRAAGRDDDERGARHAGDALGRHQEGQHHEDLGRERQLDVRRLRDRQRRRARCRASSRRG